jgi:hypothetical protein
VTVELVPYVEQNLSHSAALFRQAFAAPWATGGICAVGELAVAAQSSPNMTVQVSAGRAIVPGTNVTPPAGFAFTTQGDYYVLNDGTISVTISTANATNPRIDVIYAGTQDAFYSGSTNTALISVATGTPAPSPAVPAIPTNAIPLAQIAVGASVTSIVSGNIASVAVLAALVPAVNVNRRLYDYNPTSDLAQLLTSTSFVDAGGGFTATVTGTGRPMKITYVAQVENGGSGTARSVSFRILADGSAVGVPITNLNVPYLTTTDSVVATSSVTIFPGVPGSHTLKMQVAAGSASAVYLRGGSFVIEELY